MMTEQEAEMAYMKMVDEDKPDLWNRIEAGLPEAVAGQMKEAEKEAEKDPVREEAEAEKTGFLKKLRNFMFGGSTFRAAVSVCAACLILFVAAGGLGIGTGMIRFGASSASSDEMAYEEAAAEDAYTGSTYDEAAENGDIGLLSEDSDTSKGLVTESSAAADGLDEGDQAAGSDTASDRKLIRTIDLSVETKAFDTFIDDMKAQTEALGGYVEASTVSGTGYESDSSRWAAMTLRIPQAQTDAFLESIGDEAKITYKNETTEDVTLTYVDIESHIDALKTEQETLLGLLEKAEAMDEILEIQNELTNVRYELESYQSQLKSYDNQIDYDTIILNIQEVEEVTPYEEPGIGSRIMEGLEDSFANLGTDLQNLLVALIVSLPYIVVFFIVVYLVIWIIRKIRNRKRKSRQ